MLGLILVFHPEVQGRLPMRATRGPLAKEPLVFNTVGWGESERNLPQLLAWEGWAPSVITGGNSKRLQRNRVSQQQSET